MTEHTEDEPEEYGQPTDRSHDRELATDGGEDTDGGRKQLLVMLDAALHAEFKAETDLNDETMADVVRAAVREYVGTEPEREAEQARKQEEQARAERVELEGRIAEMQAELAAATEEVDALREREEAAAERKRQAREEAAQTKQEHTAEREEAFLEAEHHVRNGGHIFPGFPAVEEAARTCNTTPAEVIDTLKERNPSVPDHAFEEGTPHGPRWHGLRYPDRADDPPDPERDRDRDRSQERERAVDQDGDATEAATDGGTDRDPDRVL